MNIRQIALLALLGSVAMACGGVSGKKDDGTAADTVAAGSSAATGPTAAPATTAAPPAATSKDTATGPTASPTKDDAPAPAKSADGTDAPTTPAPEVNPNPLPGGGCCFQGQFFQCDNIKTCTGNTDDPDVESCEKACNNDANCLVQCLQKVQANDKPMQGCVPSDPPANITCAQ